MADIRVYQQSIDVLGQLDTPDLRVYQQSIDVLGQIDTPDLRVYQQSIDVLGQIDAPGLQVSQQNVQVLGTKSGDARVSRVYLERLVAWVPGDNVYERSVLSSLSMSDASRYSPRKLPVTDPLALTATPLYIGPIDVVASNTLSFTGTARLAGTISTSASSTLTFTDAIVQSGTIPLDVTQILAFGSFADTDTKIRGVLDVLELTETVSVEQLKVVEQTLSLSQTAIGDNGKTASNTLVFGQTATVRTSKHIQSVEHSLSFSESDTVYPHYGRAEHTLDLSQTVVYNIPTSLSVSHALIESEWQEIDDEWVLVYSGLSDSVSLAGGSSTKSNIDYIQWGETIDVVRIQVNATAVNAISDLVITDVASTGLTESVSQTLTLTQTTTATLTTTASSSLTLTDAAGILKVLNLSVTSNLDINAAFELIPDDTEVCSYDPTIGSSTDQDNPVPRPLSSPFDVSRQSIITLSHPWTEPTNSITLRVPELGNKNIIEVQRINRKTRGGTLIVWSDPQWPRNEKMVVDIKALTESKATDLLAFISLTLGKEFGYTDWENNTHKAVLLNPSTAITRGGTCKLSASLEFEITRTDPSWTGYTELDITQSVGLTHINGAPITFVDTLPLQQSSGVVLI